jgi:signal transduction histidine kinase/CheY-like chemotaxis protein
MATPESLAGGDAVAPDARGTDADRAKIAELEKRLCESEAVIKALLIGSLDSVVAAAESEPRFRSVFGEALHQAFADRRAVIEQLPCGVVVYDERGRLLFANPLAAELSGERRDPRVLPAQSLELSPADPSTLRPLSADELPVPRALAGEVVRSFECLLRASHLLSEKVLRISAVPRIGEDGKIIGAICTLIDVSERARLEKELLQADRMACVGTLAAGMAHEINNPLAYILANVAFVAEEIPALVVSLVGKTGLSSSSVVELLKALTDAREGAERIRRVVGDLRTFARAEDDVRQSINVRECLLEACQLAETEIRHRARLSKSLGPVPNVWASEGRLRQLFLNLLLNAAQSVEEASTGPHDIEVSTTTGPDGEAVILVRDSGPGIPATALPRIFDPFFSSARAASTTGMMLATSESVVHSLGGRIEVESQVGEGTLFRVILRAEADAAEPAPPRGRPVRRGRVLVVDDDVAVTDSIRRVLGREHDVTIALRAHDALEILASGEAFDIVLCDVMMPEMGGLELYAKIAELRPELLPRLAFMTGGAFTARARAFLESVPNPRLSKPFNLPALRAFVLARIAT